MMKRFVVAIALLVAVATCGVAISSRAYAVDIFRIGSQGACSNDAAASSPACGTNGTDPLTGSGGVIRKATIIVATIAGAVAVIMMIAGGLMYVLSNGDSGKIKTARDTVVYSAIGLVIIAIGQSVIIFVINRVK